MSFWCKEALLYDTILFASDYNCKFNGPMTMIHQFNRPSQLCFWCKPKTRHTIREGTNLMNILSLSFLSNMHSNFDCFIQLFFKEPYILVRTQAHMVQLIIALIPLDARRSHSTVQYCLLLTITASSTDARPWLTVQQALTTLFLA